jgi:hypothetical protein
VKLPRWLEGTAPLWGIGIFVVLMTANVAGRFIDFESAESKDRRREAAQARKAQRQAPVETVNVTLGAGVTEIVITPEGYPSNGATCTARTDPPGSRYVRVYCDSSSLDLDDDRPEIR